MTKHASKQTEKAKPELEEEKCTVDF